jgi:hypothetical protein
MNLVNELDKLCKAKSQKGGKSHSMKLKNELNDIEKRKEMIKAQCDVLLERCLNLQNGIFDYFRNLI